MLRSEICRELRTWAPLPSAGGIAPVCGIGAAAVPASRCAFRRPVVFTRLPGGDDGDAFGVLTNSSGLRLSEADYRASDVVYGISPGECRVLPHLR